MKYILRITAFPFVLCIIAIKFNYYAIKQAICVLLYGGEWITYSKDENRTIHEIYHVLKSGKIESVEPIPSPIVEDKNPLFVPKNKDYNHYRICPYCKDGFFAIHLLQKYCPEKFGKNDYCKNGMKAIKKNK
jgi:hypothetical protein